MAPSASCRAAARLGAMLVIALGPVPGLPATAGGLEERILRVPVVAADGRVEPIEVTLFGLRPGNRPVAILSHGSPRQAADRRRTGRVRFEAQSQALVDLGFVVAVPTRRGYGDSGGRWAEGYGSCSDPDYVRAGLETSRDIRAAAEAVRTLPELRSSRIVLVGQSAGAWGSLAAASEPLERLAAVVSFAGGRGSYAPDAVCNEARLIAAAGHFGRNGRVPTLWIYSANDHYFRPELARKMHQAFVASGGQAQLLVEPEVGGDGHQLFEHVELWPAQVRAFLDPFRAAPDNPGAAGAGKGT